MESVCQGEGEESSWSYTDPPPRDGAPLTVSSLTPRVVRFLWEIAVVRAGHRADATRDQGDKETKEPSDNHNFLPGRDKERTGISTALVRRESAEIRTHTRTCSQHTHTHTHMQPTHTHTQDMYQHL